MMEKALKNILLVYLFFSYLNVDMVPSSVRTVPSGGQAPLARGRLLWTLRLPLPALPLPAGTLAVRPPSPSLPCS